MFIPQVLYIVEMNDVDVSHAFSQASPDLRMVFPLRRCRQSRNMEIMTGGTVTVIAAQILLPANVLVLMPLEVEAFCFGLEPARQLSRRLRH